MLYILPPPPAVRSLLEKYLSQFFRSRLAFKIAASQTRRLTRLLQGSTKACLKDNTYLKTLTWKLRFQKCWLLFQT